MKRLILIFLLLAFCIGCDQSTKFTAQHFLADQQTLSYMGDLFRLSYARNTGGFLSIGAGLPKIGRYAFLIVLPALFLTGFMLFVLCSRKLNTMEIAAGTLIIGGGLGNLIDRIMYDGSVIDFMNIGIGPIRTGIFNVADMAIMAGVLMLAILQFRTQRNRTSATDS